MARSEARIFCSIWRKADFIALTPDEQRMYFLLLSQPDLAYTGVLPLRVRRWVSCSAHTEPDDVVTALGALEQQRFVLIDLDTEELLIRSFIRNDELYKQPQLLTAAERSLGEIASPRLREALADDLDRIPVDDLSDAPTVRGKDKKQGPSLRVQVTEILHRMSSELRPTATPREPLPRPSGSPPEPLGQALGDAGARAHLLSPSSCLLAPVSKSVSDGTSEISTEQPVSTPIETVAAAAVSDTGKRILTAHVGRLTKRPPDRVVGQLAAQIQALLVEGIDPADITAGLAIVRDRNLNPAALPNAVNEHMQRPGVRAVAAADECPDHPGQPAHNCGAHRADRLAGTA